MTKLLNVLIGGLLTFTFILTSCSEDASVLGLTDTENFVDESLEGTFAAERGGEKCLELVYPVTVVFPDESTLEVADRAEQKEAIKAWIEENGREAGKPTLQFPVDAVNSDGETISVASADEMKALLEECGPRGGRNGRKGKGPRGGFGSCLDLVYPVTLVFPDETSVEVADQEAQKEAVKAWIEANGREAGKPELQFPVDVVNSDDETLTANSADELKELAQACRGERRNRCFSLVFPLSISLPDGTTQEVADHKEIKQAARAWKEANPDSEERPELVFPLSVELEDGTTQEVASQEDLEALKESCNS